MPSALPILNCDNCCACCMNMRSPPFLIFYSGSHETFEDSWKSMGDDVIATAEFKRFMRAPLVARRERWERLMANVDQFPDESPCVWLDLENGNCRHYEHRPDICRDFEVGGDGCRRQRREAGIP